jgi:hypothetical protein
MALTDKITQASWKLTQDSKGMTGELSVVVPRANKFDTDMPGPGDVWPFPEDNAPVFLRCVSAEWSALGHDDVCQGTYYYSTERQLGEEFAEVSCDWSGELVDQTKGWEWEDTGNPVDIEIPTAVPTVEYAMRRRVAPPPYEAVSEAINKVNDRVFRGFSAGCLRFDGISNSESYDINGNVISTSVTYKFTGRGISWQQVWRPPVIARDADGREMYYQAQDPNNTATYSETLDGQPIYVSGDAGTGGWDKPTLDDEYRYGVCDFGAVLALPKLPGDG